MSYKIQTITRTAAMIYAEDQSSRTSKSVKRAFVDAVLVNTDNQPCKIDKIVTKLQEDYELVFQEKELLEIIGQERYYEIIYGKKKQDNQYYLPTNRFEKLKGTNQFNIDSAIEDYIANNPDIDSAQLKKLLYDYLYMLLNTNMAAFNQLLERKEKGISSIPDTSSFNDEEIEVINKFLSYDDPGKDKALYVLINYCIEYASAFNSIDPQDIVSALKNKILYLDNALIFRALGINGQLRKTRAENLFQRCIDSGQKLFISSITRKEFFDSIDFHINQLKRTSPYGSINPILFRYTGGYTIYQYYHEWRRNRKTYGFEAFRIHIKEEFDALLKKFRIEEDFKQKFNEKDDKKIESYSDEIQLFKNDKNKILIDNDAKNIIWIEKSRNGCDGNVRDTKYYFLTSDKKLQDWDLKHSDNHQPITMLPSQWLALLLKYFSRSNNDYKSFVSFLSIPQENVSKTPEELQEILAGISEITEDFKKQEDIVSALIELNEPGKKQNREYAKQFAKDKIESEYKKKLEDLEHESQRKIQEQEEYSSQLVAKKEEELKQLVSEFREERKKEKIERIEDRITFCEAQLKDKQTILNQINSICDKKKRLFIWLIIGGYILYILVLCYKIFFIYNWEFMEPITYISGLIVAGIPFIYSHFKNKSIDIRNIPIQFRERCFKKQCNRNNFHKSDIEDLSETLNALKKERRELDMSSIK